MAIYEFRKDGITSLAETTFSANNWRERDDLQRCLRDNIKVIAPDTLVIAEEFCEWDDAKRRIDLLAIDKQANLVIIELKRTEDGGHMDLQAIRYAAMASTMTLDNAEKAYQKYIRQVEPDKDPLQARARILEFLDWTDGNMGEFGEDVRIVLASAEFSKEVTSCVLWLNQKKIDIRCVRLKPYIFDGRLLVDIQQVLPLPEAAEYQIKIVEKVSHNREIAEQSGSRDFTRFDVSISGQASNRLAKRNAIFFVCKYLCEHGISPDDVANLFPSRRKKVWYSLDGELDVDAFLERALAGAQDGGLAFDKRRWFCDRDDDLVVKNGRTYAFSNQWGGDDWAEAMQTLRETYPQFHISFVSTETVAA